jgi:hypothetical protein
MVALREKKETEKEGEEEGRPRLLEVASREKKETRKGGEVGVLDHG